MCFIEIMPIGNTQEWGQGFTASGTRFYPVQEMHSNLAALNLDPVPPETSNETARTFRIPGALGTVVSSPRLASTFASIAIACD
jgi:hypothetical protein